MASPMHVIVTLSPRSEYEQDTAVNTGNTTVHAVQKCSLVTQACNSVKDSMCVVSNQVFLLSKASAVMRCSKLGSHYTSGALRSGPHPTCKLWCVWESAGLNS